MSHFCKQLTIIAEKFFKSICNSLEMKELRCLKKSLTSFEQILILSAVCFQGVEGRHSLKFGIIVAFYFLNIR